MKIRSLIGALVLLVPVATAAPREYQVRLLTPLASYSKVGTLFQAKVIGATRNPVASDLARDTLIFGSILRAKPTGLGLRRERAELELGFDRCEAPGGEDLPCDIVLASVDNAREEVKDGRIRGILAASHPNSWLNGVWYRPDLARIPRTAMGLSGAGGMLSSRLLPGFTGAPIALAAHLLLYRMPEPEIEIPSGTDLILQINAADRALPVLAGLASAVAPELLELVAAIVPQVTKARSVPALDLLNVAFLGDADQVIQAFEAAGWFPADTNDTKAFFRSYAAYARKSTWPTAPVSPLYNRELLPDMVFQKSFNTIAKRHHVRLWAVDVPGGTAWVGAATQDTSITYNMWRMKLSHDIDLAIDRERTVLFNDLAAAGCLQSEQKVERPELFYAGGIGARTDGDMTVAVLQVCHSPTAQRVAPQRPHRSKVMSLFRQVVLDTRYSVTRGNAYYLLYTGLRRIHTDRKVNVVEDATVRRPGPATPLAAAFVDDE